MRQLGITGYGEDHRIRGFGPKKLKAQAENVQRKHCSLNLEGRGLRYGDLLDLKPR